MMTAGLYGAARVIALDLDANRLEQARSFGATDTVNSGRRRLGRPGHGDDRRASGSTSRSRRSAFPRPSTPAPGSSGPAGRSPTWACTAPRSSWPSQDLWIMDLSITMGLVSTSTTPMLLKLVAQHKLAAERVRHPPLHARRDARRLRHLRPGRGDQGAQGGHHALSPDRAWVRTPSGRHGAWMSSTPSSSAVDPTGSSRPTCSRTPAGRCWCSRRRTRSAAPSAATARCTATCTTRSARSTPSRRSRRRSSALGLEQHGLAWSHAPAVAGTPFADGSWALLHRTAEDTAAGAGRPGTR